MENCPKGVLKSAFSYSSFLFVKTGKTSAFYFVIPMMIPMITLYGDPFD